MNKFERAKSEKELVAAWLKYKMNLADVSKISLVVGDDEQRLPPGVTSKKILERQANGLIDILSNLEPPLGKYQAIVDVSFDGHVTINVV